MSLYESKFAESLDVAVGPIEGRKNGAVKNGAEVRQSFAQQSKKISQLIAKSWLPDDPEGTQIKKVLIEGNSEKINEMLKKYGVDLEVIFHPLSIHVDWDTFFGKMAETTVGGGTWLYSLPYPPRPNEVTDAQLTDWVNNQDPNQQFPPNPYIPLSPC